MYGRIQQFGRSDDAVDRTETRGIADDINDGHLSRQLCRLSKTRPEVALVSLYQRGLAAEDAMAEGWT